jgi:hypothetical protein
MMQKTLTLENVGNYMDNQQLDKFCYDFTQQVTEWAVQNIYKDFTLTTKLDWNPTRRCSRGGMYAKGPGINIAMKDVYPRCKGEIYRFYEYPSYDSNSVIGGFYSREPIHKTQAILLHEVAHALQYFAYKKNNTRCKPHGPMFKNFYKRLRIEFLNHKLPEQLELKHDYEQYKARLEKQNYNVLKSQLIKQLVA